MGGGTPYAVHRTPYSGSPGAWPAPLARILPFRRYTPKTPKTPPSPPLLPPPGELSAVRALSFLKFEFSHPAVFSAIIIYFPPKPTFTLPEPDLTSSSSNPPDSTTLHRPGDTLLPIAPTFVRRVGVRSLSERASEYEQGVSLFFFFFLADGKTHCSDIQRL